MRSARERERERDTERERERERYRERESYRERETVTVRLGERKAVRQQLEGEALPVAWFEDTLLPVKQRGGALLGVGLCSLLIGW